MTLAPELLAVAVTIGAAWRDHRAELGLSRQQAATLMQLSEEGLRRIELGFHIPKGDTLMRAAFLYRCTVDELLPVDYASLMDERWLELLGRRSERSLPQGQTAKLAVVPQAAAAAAPGKGGKGRSSTRSTAAASTIRSAASAAAAKAADTDAAPTPEVAQKPAASRKATRSRRIQTTR